MAAATNKMQHGGTDEAWNDNFNSSLVDAAYYKMKHLPPPRSTSCGLGSLLLLLGKKLIGLPPSVWNARRTVEGRHAPSTSIQFFIFMGYILHIVPGREGAD
jgi:hypothetical protein